jgi:DNA-binding GntR family transcriptional regulator
MRYFYLVISMDGYGRQLVDEHRAIARAIRRRDSELARQKSSEHLQLTMDRSAKLNLGTISLGEDSGRKPMRISASGVRGN